MIDIESKFLGAMVGSAIGDAIGEIAFRISDRERLLAYVGTVPELRYTDDTAMAIGLAESITKEAGINQGHLSRLVKALAAKALIASDKKHPRLLVKVPRTFFQRGRRG